MNCSRCNWPLLEKPSLCAECQRVELFNLAARIAGRAILSQPNLLLRVRGMHQPMGNTLDSWACPLCNSPLILTEYPSKRGFRLTCKGIDAVPHRLRIYLEGFRKDASFLPAPAVMPAPRNSRVKDLLTRAERLAGEETQAA